MSQKEANITDVNDNYLEKIVGMLLIPEQVTFARVCKRFRNAFINWNKIHGKHYTFNPDFESERERQSYFRLVIPGDFNWSGGGLIFPREDQKLYFELVGPFIETIHINLTVFALRVISTYCSNLKEISCPLDLEYLVPLIECRSLNSLYLIGDEDHSETTEAIENFITCLTKLSNLTRLRVVKTFFQGQALCKLLTLRELILIDCGRLLPVNLEMCFKQIGRLEKLHLPVGLQYTQLFRNMALNCHFLTELSCYVSSFVKYEIIPQLSQLINLQIWSNHEIVRREFFVALVREKGQQLQVLRIYNAQITIRDVYYVGKIATLRELKIILPDHLNNFRALLPLQRLEYLQIFDQTDAAQYLLSNVATTLTLLVCKCRYLSTLYLSYCKNLTKEFIHELITILRGMERLYEGPLRVFTYGTDIDESILNDEQYQAAGNLIRVYYMSLTRPQVNSLSLMNNYFQ